MEELIELEVDLSGVSNGFLSEIIRTITGYDICPYCRWEDDGTTDIGAYRSINKGSILEHRKKISEDFNKYYLGRWLKE